VKEGWALLRLKAYKRTLILPSLPVLKGKAKVWGRIPMAYLPPVARDMRGVISAAGD
jgi:hypothetical protein